MCIALHRSNFMVYWKLLQMKFYDFSRPWAINSNNIT
jgi:hypothetical protein